MKKTWRDVPATVWTLGFVSMLMDVSSEMIHGLLPIYLVTALGVSTLTVGVIEGVAEATASIVKVFSGAVSDWLGKRKVLTALGYGMAACTKPIFPLAPSVGWLIVARFVDRVGKGIRGAPRDALIADVSPSELRGASFGLRQSLDTIGAFVGPCLAIALMWATAGHFTIVFWFAVVPAFLSFALILFAVREPDRLSPSEGTRTLLSIAELKRLGPSYWRVVSVAAIFTLARFSEAFLILRAQSIGLSSTFAPLVLVSMNIAYAASAYPIGILSDRIQRVTFLVYGAMLLLSSDLVLGLLSNQGGLWLGVVLWGLHMGFAQGVFAAFVADAAPPDLRGTAFGFFNMVVGVASLLASVVAGALWELAGPSTTFFASAALATATLLVLPSLMSAKR
jgi:MFS family permease